MGGQEDDEFEHWLDREIEAPAAEPLKKALSNSRLTPEDWERLIQFAAAQDVRTPARYIEQLQRWHRTLPGILKESLKELLDELEALRARGVPVPTTESDYSKDAPVRVTIEKRSGDKEQSIVKAEVTPGRGMWLWQMKLLLQETARILHQHRWTILHAPEGTRWFTSDNPVLRLNFQSLREYDFRGGWGSQGTDFLMPLGPRHLLYTQIGVRPPSRGETLAAEHAALVRRFMAENAGRMIFASSQDADAVKLRPRVVSQEQFHREREQWTRWHEQQSAAEIELNRTRP